MAITIALKFCKGLSGKFYEPSETDSRSNVGKFRPKVTLGNKFFQLAIKSEINNVC